MSSLLTFCGQVLLSKAIAFLSKEIWATFVSVASSFYTHICHPISQTQKRTKPPYTFG